MIERTRLAQFFAVKCGEESGGSKVVGVGYVCVDGKVEEVGAGTELKLCLALVVRGEHAREEQEVTHAVDACGTDCASQEASVGGRAVVGEDFGFSDGLYVIVRARKW